jgi:hypothetical protein
MTTGKLENFGAEPVASYSLRPVGPNQTVVAANPPTYMKPQGIRSASTAVCWRKASAAEVASMQRWQSARHNRRTSFLEQCGIDPHIPRLCGHVPTHIS